jgi:hypothetical protein
VKRRPSRRYAQGRILVSAGASRPRFAHGGHDLFYVSGSRDASGGLFGVLMSLGYGAGAPVTHRTASRLFDDRENGLELSAYAVGAEGRFIIPKSLPPPPGKGERVVLIENWPSLVRR